MRIVKTSTQNTNLSDLKTVQCRPTGSLPSGDEDCRTVPTDTEKEQATVTRSRQDQGGFELWVWTSRTLADELFRFALIISLICKECDPAFYVLEVFWTTCIGYDGVVLC